MEIVILNYYDQFLVYNETGYANVVLETFQNKSELSSSSDSVNYASFIGVLLLSLLTTGGNLVIILSVTKSTNLSGTNYSVYIVSLAYADFLVGLLVMPLMVIYTYYGYWPLGNVPCTVFIVLDYVVCLTSQVHLSAIAYDRLQSVAQPLKYRSSFTRGRATKICVCLWVGTFLFWTPGVVVTRVLKAVDGSMVLDQCYYLPNKYYVLASILLYYLITDILLVMLSILLVRALRTRNVPEIGENNPVPTDKHMALTSRVLSQELNKVSDQNRRVIRTLVILINVYGICIMPWKVFFPIMAFCDSCIPETAYRISYWMSYANSFVNPYLYLSFNSDFRLAFRQVFCHR